MQFPYSACDFRVFSQEIRDVRTIIRQIDVVKDRLLQHERGFRDDLGPIGILLNRRIHLFLPLDLGSLQPHRLLSLTLLIGIALNGLLGFIFRPIVTELEPVEFTLVILVFGILRLWFL